MPPITYNIPASMIEMYRGRNLIVRTDNLSELDKSLTPEALKNIVYIELLTLKDSALQNSQIYNTPLDLVVSDPVRDLPRLYNYTQWADKHPVRVSVPVAPGFVKTVKLATALNFAVKLIPGQPDSQRVEEMADVLNFYLRQSTVSQPVEFFHTMLFAFYNDNPLNLWTVCEENPFQYRYITDQGRETISARFTDTELPDDLNTFDKTFIKRLCDEASECLNCEFFANCEAYFKWPNRDFSCADVKMLLRTLQEAAAELKRDYAASTNATEKKPL
ncbi:hypothetical protein QUF75_19055 [Desulfococcaceae bacterium HSG7]|nr:hypothetical protein [Desulfococcaceae bacterium HSG7]